MQFLDLLGAADNLALAIPNPANFNVSGGTLTSNETLPLQPCDESFAVTYVQQALNDTIGLPGAEEMTPQGV